MVISGHNNFKPDVLKPKEMVSLLIDDDALKQKLEQAQATRPERAEKRKTVSRFMIILQPPVIGCFGS